MNNKKSQKKPFFASFLEKQVKDGQAVTGGAVTSVLVDAATTSILKDGATSPNHDQVTMKYPSDSDEAGELS